MTAAELCQLRLANQQISMHHFTKPEDVVTWLGAMQAQDYNMVRWAVGVRLAESKRAMIQQAIDSGAVIRTHLPRSTWHLVAAKDASWMMDLAAPQIKAIAKSRLKELDLTPADLKKALNCIEKELAGRQHLTRDEMLLALERKKVDTTGQRAAYILLWAEIEKLICSGPLVDNKNTYALFDERVGKQKRYTREEALMHLATRYFTSRGPATLQDFVNWSALPITEAKKALEMIKQSLVSATIDSKTYWFKEPPDDIRVRAKRSEVYLLPAFDEFIIGYKERSATLAPKHKSAVISVNGIFWPVIVVNGFVTGLWKRIVEKGQVKIELNYFPRSSAKNDKEIKKLVSTAARHVQDFFSDEGQAGS